MSKSGWQPPRGALSVIHQRTIPDILLRDAIINVLSLLAYYHLIRTLSRQRCSCQYPPSLRYVMPLLAIFLPELVPIQLCSWFIQHRITKSWNIHKTSPDHNDRRKEKTKDKQHDLALNTHSSIRTWATKHVTLSLLNLIPLYFALQAYRERLSMRYHDALYVANLLIDHRNGWAAAAGLLSTLATITLITYLYSTGQLRIIQQQHHHHNSSQDIKSLEKLEEARRQPSPPPPPPHTSLNPRSILRAFKTFWLTPLSSLSPLQISEVFLASILHQIPLRATNRRASSFSEASHILILLGMLVPMLFATAVWERYLLRKAGVTSSNVVRRKVVYALAVAVAMWFVELTMIDQAGTDGLELREISMGVVWPWNYRWMVKDRLSGVWGEEGGERVYLG